jgi:hypothetical protein
MGFNVVTWIVTKAKTDAGLLAAFTSANKIFVAAYPALNVVALTPCVTYAVDDASDIDYADDAILTENWIIALDIFTATGNVETLMNALDTFMRANGFSKSASVSLYENNTGIYHRSLRYVKRATADDLV